MLNTELCSLQSLSRNRLAVLFSTAVIFLIRVYRAFCIVVRASQKHKPQVQRILDSAIIRPQFITINCSHFHAGPRLQNNISKMAIQQQFDNSTESLTMGTCPSSNSFEFNTSSSFDFPCGGNALGDLDDLEDLALFSQTRNSDLDTPQSTGPIAGNMKVQKHTSFPPRESKVKFSTVETRSYAITIGDNPSCGDELPLSLDWKFNPTAKIEQVESEDMADDYHYPAQRLSYFERKLRLQEVANISVDGIQQQKRESSISSFDDEIQLDDLPRPVNQPTFFISQAAWKEASILCTQYFRQVHIN